MSDWRLSWRAFPGKSRMHFTTTSYFSPPELDRFLEFAAALKQGEIKGDLNGKSLGMLFFDPSLRTQTSFAVAMQQLGGHSLTLNVGHGVWGIETEDEVVMDGDKAEHVREAAPVLSRYFDALAIRAFPAGRSWQIDSTDPVLSGFNRHATVPVINLESSLWHPCQALGDALTWDELGLKPGSRLVLTWAYHPRALPLAVPRSVALMAVQRGLNLTVLRPPEFALDQELGTLMKGIAAHTGASIQESDDWGSLEGAQVVYAKSWRSLLAYQDPQKEQKIRDQYRHWQVTEEFMARTAAASFMHCLPVRRNMVVSDQVLDSPRSVVIDQAENRLHVQKALLLHLLGEQTGHSVP